MTTAQIYKVALQQEGHRTVLEDISRWLGHSDIISMWVPPECIKPPVGTTHVLVSRTGFPRNLVRALNLRVLEQVEIRGIKYWVGSSAIQRTAFAPALRGAIDGKVVFHLQPCGTPIFTYL